MSLQIWLPLNGDLHNQGILPKTFTTVGNAATFSPTGKIGQALIAPGNTYFETDNITVGKNWSVACWAKAPSASGSKMLWTLSTPDNYTKIISFYHSNGVYALNCTLEGAGDAVKNPFQNNNGALPILTDGNWHHFVITFYEDQPAILYIDGQWAGTAPTYKDPTFTNGVFRFCGGYLGAHGKDWQGELNDLKLYNHCLSPQEVKELGKGLVLHYKLSRQLNTASNNLVSDTKTFDGWTIQEGWERIVENNGDISYHFSRTGATEAVWRRIIPPLSINPDDYPNGITVSLDLYTPNVAAITRTIIGALQVYQADNTRIGWYEPSWDLSSVRNNIWTRISYTFTQADLKTLQTTGATIAYTKFSFQLVRDGDIKIKNIKIEDATSATSIYTPFTQSSSNNNIEYDCSGYGRHADRIGPLSAENDSPRYKTSTHFLATSALWNILNPIQKGCDEFTFSLWLKPNDLTTNACLYNARAAVGQGLTIFKIAGRVRFEDNATWEQTAVFSEANKWYHIVCTRTNAGKKLYINGEKKAETTTVGTMDNILPVASIGCSSSSSGLSNGNQLLGNLSDFRIYATALSDEDILELYHTGQKIDNGNNIYAYEFIEGDV